MTLNDFDFAFKAFLKETNPKNIENKWDHGYWDKNDDFDDIKSTYSILYAKSLKLTCDNVRLKKELKFKDPNIMDWDMKIVWL